LEINIQNSGNAKSELNEQIDDYVLSLHNISDNSKEHYSALLKVFVRYLTNRGILSFNDVKRTETQIAQLNHCTETIRRLLELGRQDLADQYIELLLTTWVKMFLL
jgi:hypothetical protein